MIRLRSSENRRQAPYHMFHVHLKHSLENALFSVAPSRTTKVGGTKRPPVTKRVVQVKGCDDDDNIRVQDEQTLNGTIIVQDCPCEKRFANNATRLATIATAVQQQLRLYFQQLYKNNIDYPVSVSVRSGNQTHTIFNYVVKVPKSEHNRAREALKKTCKDEHVSVDLLIASMTRMTKPRLSTFPDQGNN